MSNQPVDIDMDDYLKIADENLLDSSILFGLELSNNMLCQSLSSQDLGDVLNQEFTYLQVYRGRQTAQSMAPVERLDGNNFPTPQTLLCCDSSTFIEEGGMLSTKPESPTNLRPSAPQNLWRDGPSSSIFLNPRIGTCTPDFLTSQEPESFKTPSDMFDHLDDADPDNYVFMPEVPTFLPKSSFNPTKKRIYNLSPPSLENTSFNPSSGGSVNSSWTSSLNSVHSSPTTAPVVSAGFRPLMMRSSKLDLAREIRRSLICPAEGDENSPLALYPCEDTYAGMGSGRQHGFTRQGMISNLMQDGSSTCLEDGNRVSGEHLLVQCINLIQSAISPTGGAEYFTTLDESISETEDYPVNKHGIEYQRIIGPPGGPLYMTDEEMRDITDSWICARERSDTFFRIEDKRGRKLTLRELTEVIKSITSRPPRRINYYTAYQMGTHGSIGQGQTVTDWGNRASSSMHCPSSQTRIAHLRTPPHAVMSDPYSQAVDIGDFGRQNDADECRPVKNIKKHPQNTYDPTWVRGSGTRKEGWCDHCESGGYFLMKNSGYLYHKNHEHGLFPNGNVFEDPLIIRRKLERESKWEGLCGICYHWIDLDHTERKHWGTWYRHYKQCANEYEEFKKVLAAAGAPVKLIEISYKPYREYSDFST